VGVSPRNYSSPSPSRAAAKAKGALVSGTYSNLVYHIVFSTKNRYRLITLALEENLHKYIGGIIREIGGVCLEINGTSDHVHILTKLPPKVAMSDALRTIKANSSKWINESTQGLRKFGWQDGYAAFCVSKSQIRSVQQYVRAAKEHTGQLVPFAQVLLSFCLQDQANRVGMAFHQFHLLRPSATHDRQFVLVVPGIAIVAAGWQFQFSVASAIGYRHKRHGKGVFNARLVIPLEQ
jgi:putative transposase